MIGGVRFVKETRKSNMNKVDKLTELVQALEEYITLLGKELDEVIPMAAVHGWKSTRFEEGKKLRALISAQREKMGGK